MNNLNIHTVRVFVDEKGMFGNPVGIILDEGKKIPTVKRQRIVKDLRYSESVFINDINDRNISIYNPQQEIAFSGHALIGTAWYFSNFLKKKVDFIECQGERIFTWQEGGNTWIKANLSSTPLWNQEKLDSAAAVENLSKSETTLKKHTIVWAWLDKNKSIIRARTFAPDWGIPEDEANGSGAMQLSATLGCDLTVIHGKGSVIYTKNQASGIVAVGGRVKISSLV